MLPAVTPVLLNETAEPAAKCVNCPVICTPVSTWPCCPVVELIVLRSAVPEVTVNRLLPVATSLPLVTVTLDAPVVALAAIVTVAVR